MVILAHFDVPDEGLVYQNLNVTLKINNTILRSGSLFIAEKTLNWRQHNCVDGLSIPWPKVSLHAITSTPQRCVYAMLDFVLVWPGTHDPHQNGNGHHSNGGGDIADDAGDGDDDEEKMTEMWFVPADVQEVRKIYRSMTHCQSLQLDPNDSYESDGEYVAQPPDTDDSDDNGAGGIQNMVIDGMGGDSSERQTP